MAWPGTYPSGGPLPQVHDVWRAGAPAIDILAPDLYLQYFDEVCDRFTRNGNPLFIPETGANAANVLAAFGKYGAIGYSPFAIERSVSADSELAAAYRLVSQMAPMIAAHQGKDSITAVRMNQGDAPKRVAFGKLHAGAQPIRGEARCRSHLQPKAVRGQAPAVPPGQPGRGGAAQAPMQAAAILIAAGPDEYYMAGGGLRIGFTANTPGPATVGLGIVQEGKFVDGKWVVVRQLGGDDIGQGEISDAPPEYDSPRGRLSVRIRIFGGRRCDGELCLTESTYTHEGFTYTTPATRALTSQFMVDLDAG